MRYDTVVDVRYYTTWADFQSSSERVEARNGGVGTVSSKLSGNVSLHICILIVVE